MNVNVNVNAHVNVNVSVCVCVPRCLRVCVCVSVSLLAWLLACLLIATGWFMFESLGKLLVTGLRVKGQIDWLINWQIDWLLC